MKKFIVIGNQNACIYKEFFPYMKTGEVCTGYNHIKEFKKPNNTIQKFGNICWFSNLYIYKENDLVLSKTYDEKEYQRYDNYDAINTDKIKDIPIDYTGAIGVPITILDKVSTGGIIHLNYELYNINGKLNHPRDKYDFGKALVKGKELYPRILIQKADYSIVKNMATTTVDENSAGYPYINGEKQYARVLIQKADYSIIDLNNRYSVLDVAGKNEEAIKNHKFMTAIEDKPKYPRVIIKKK